MSDTAIIDQLLSGRLDDLPELSSRSVRVFISSTFTDMTVERNWLMENAYPKLKEYCRKKYGLEFQVVDMRWGVREEAQNDHMTTDLCLKEIGNCKRQSVGPSFIVFLGQKYGSRFFPSCIPASEFEMILDAVRCTGSETELLDTWFKKDENQIPAVYNLQPINSILVHYNDEDNPDLKKQDRQKWWSIYVEIQKLLRVGVKLCMDKGKMDEQKGSKYFISVTEDEVRHGILPMNPRSSGSLCILRTIENIQDDIQNPNAAKFVDMAENQLKIDEEAQNMLSTLKSNVSPAAEVFTIPWDSERGVNPSVHRSYLDQLNTVVHNKMIEMIETAVLKQNKVLENPLVTEIIHHLSICKARCKTFQGREKILDQVTSYFHRNSTQALVVYGNSGSGKTSVMAKTASLIYSTLKQCVPVVILRFLGTTPASSTITQTLSSVCHQIAAGYNRPTEDIPSEHTDLVPYFQGLLKVATRDNPLVVMLDSLDQLSPQHQAHKLNWLPRQLPPHVYIIVSTLPEMYNILDVLQGMITDKNNFVEVPSLGENLSISVLLQWLKEAGRTVTDVQLGLVKQAFKVCSLPLYTKLIFDEVCSWKSYVPKDQTRLENSIKGCISTFFSRLEIQHGYLFVSHALSYITATQTGVSESELEDLLSLDDVVLNEVFVYWLPPLRRIPPSLWARLRNQLGGYLVEREAGGSTVVYWYHRQFIETATERYLLDEKFCNYIHVMLVDYFSGKWFNVEKPFTYTSFQMKRIGITDQNGMADRKVASQPLIYSDENADRKLYNLRKLIQLPFHLSKLNMWTELKSLLFSYEWLHAKLSATGLQEMLSDFDLCISINPDDDLKLLYQSLRVAGATLNSNPDTLPVEIAGRLLPFYDDQATIKALIDQCDTIGLGNCWLLPVFQCFSIPEQFLVHSLEYHSRAIRSIIIRNNSDELFSTSMDRTLAQWDLIRGELLQVHDVTVTDVEKSTEVKQSPNGKYVICEDYRAAGKPVFVYKENENPAVYTFDAARDASDYFHPTLVTNTFICRGRGLYKVATGERVYDLQALTPITKYVTMNITPDEKLLLITHDKKGLTHEETLIFDLENGQGLGSLPGQHIASRIAFTKDSQKAAIGYVLDCTIKIFDINPKSVNFCTELMLLDHQQDFPNRKFLDGDWYSKEVSEIKLSSDASMVVAILKRMYVVAWVLEPKSAILMNTDSIDVKEESRHIRHLNISLDGSLVLASERNSVYVWNSKCGDLLTCFKAHASRVHWLKLSKRTNIAATISKDDFTIKVWDLSKLENARKDTLTMYGNRMDTVACSLQNKLLFVKLFIPLTDEKGYFYTDYFGIDVWNISTNEKQTFIPFDKYGTISKIALSDDASVVCIMFSQISGNRIGVIRKPYNSLMYIEHPHCVQFHISCSGAVIVTESKSPDNKMEIKMWDTFTGQCIEIFDNWKTSILSLNEQHLYMFGKKGKVAIYSSESKSVTDFSIGSDQVTKLYNIPNQETFIIAQTNAKNKAGSNLIKISLDDHKAAMKLQEIHQDGLQDISRDGNIGIDATLQLVSLKTMSRQEILNADGKPKKLVRLTFDGCFAIWVDNQPTDCVKVCQTATGNLIANCSLHTPVVSLCLIDFGYTLVAGGQDGRIFTLCLAHRNDVVKHRSNYKERRQYIVDISKVSENSINKLDPAFSSSPTMYISNLPKCAPNVLVQMKDKHFAVNTTKFLTTERGSARSRSCHLL